MKGDNALILATMAVIGLAVSSALGLACGAGNAQQQEQIAVYGSLQTVCVTQATSFDAGLACLATVKRSFCGPGGLWADAGLCPDGGAP